VSDLHVTRIDIAINRTGGKHEYQVDGHPVENFSINFGMSMSATEPPAVTLGGFSVMYPTDVYIDGVLHCHDPGWLVRWIRP
jgi:hypothetical protein